MSPTQSCAAEKLQRKQRARARQTTLPSYLFIARQCCPPFAFPRKGKLTNVNLAWIKTGHVDEMDYLEERGMSSLPGVPVGLTPVTPPRTLMGAQGPEESQMIDLSLESEDDEEPSLSSGKAEEQSPVSSRNTMPSPLEAAEAPFNPFSGAGASHRSGGLAWTAAQEKALLQGHLKFGDGRNWREVVEMVNRVSPRGKEKTQKQCQDKWSLTKKKWFSG